MSVRPRSAKQQHARRQRGDHLGGQSAFRAGAPPQRDSERGVVPYSTSPTSPTSPICGNAPRPSPRELPGRPKKFVRASLEGLCCDQQHKVVARGDVVVPDEPDVVAVARSISTLPELSRLLRRLRRREARARPGGELTYRELSTRMHCSVTTIGEYLTGVRLPPANRFDVLAQALGATPAEMGALSTAWDRVADGQRRAEAGSSPEPPVPRELPASDSGLVGRESELAALHGLLAVDDESPATVIAIVSGMAGVGKTALALECARQVSDRFPDGQLFVNLRGYDPDEPVDPGDALAAFLRSLGVADTAIPANLDERAARFRSLVAQRRMLVLIDNARTAEQVRPLLPGTRSSRVVVTSRDELAGLVTSPGARRLDLAPLTLRSAEDLLRTGIGKRAEDDPLATTALAQRCGRLPLALRIAVDLVTGRSGTSLAALVSDLADAEREGEEAGPRLELFDGSGDARTSVRSVFSWSLQALPAQVGRAFMLLGLHPGGDVDATAAAALVGVGRADVRALIGQLIRAHLVDPAGPDSYAMHDLLRAYAAEQAIIRLTPDDRRAALTRLFEYYRRAAEAASSIAYPAAGSRRPDTPDLPELADRQGARAWLDANRANLVAACRYAARHGWPEQSIALSIALWLYLDHGHDSAALVVHTSAADAVRAGGGDRADHGSVLTNLGRAYWRLGRPADALAPLQEALRRHENAGNREGISRTLGALGLVYDTLGHYDRSIECNDRGLAHARQSGDQFAQVRHLINLGHSRLRLEQYEQAQECYRLARHIGEQLDMPRGRVIADHGLGVAARGMGRYDEALERLYDEALERLYDVLARDREFGDGAREIQVLDSIAEVYRRLKRFDDAVAHLEDALARSHRFDVGLGRMAVFNTLGETMRDSEDFAAALSWHGEALTLARQIGDRFQQARALEGLGDGHQGAGDLCAALDHWRQAHRGYTELGHPAADRVWAKIDDAAQRHE